MSVDRVQRVAIGRLLRFADPVLEAEYCLRRWETLRPSIVTGLSALMVLQVLLIVVYTLAGLDHVVGWNDIPSLVGITCMLLAARFSSQRVLLIVYQIAIAVTVPTMVLDRTTNTANQILVFVYWLEILPVLLAERFAHIAYIVPIDVGLMLVCLNQAPAETSVYRSLHEFGSLTYNVQIVSFTAVLMWSLYQVELSYRRSFAQARLLAEENVKLELEADPFSLGAITDWFEGKTGSSEEHLTDPLLPLYSGYSSKPRSGGNQWDIAYSDVDLIRIVGAGGSGRVFEARYSGQQVAVKELFQAIASPTELEDFASECRTLYRLRHPNIVAFFGICAHELRTFLVTEFLPYELTDLLLNHDDARLPPVHEMARQLAAGCKYMHSQGVVHCDLKPQNVLVSETFTLKLCDFGLSRLVGGEGGGASFLSSAVGTAQFMAPELFLSAPRAPGGAKIADATKLDVYAFAMILWCLLARDLPFAECGWGELATKALNGERPEVDPDWDEALVGLMRVCWHSDPRERPSFDEINEELQGLRESDAEVLTLPKLSLS